MGFGKGVDVHDKLLNFINIRLDYLQDNPNTVVTGWDCAMLAREAYHEFFNLRDHCYIRDLKTNNYRRHHFHEKASPLALVSMNTKTGLIEACSPYRKHFDDYRSYGVKEATGMAYDVWMRLPVSMQTDMLDSLKEETRMRHVEIEKERNKHKSPENIDLSDENAARLMAGSRY